MVRMVEGAGMACPTAVAEATAHLEAAAELVALAREAALRGAATLADRALAITARMATGPLLIPTGRVAAMDIMATHTTVEAIMGAADSGLAAQATTMAGLPPTAVGTMAPLIVTRSLTLASATVGA